MKVTQIKLTNYRNLAQQTVTPSEGLNIFFGQNAQGKTNLVESVYLCCIGKSPRTEKDKDLIAWGKNDALVQVQYTCKFGEGSIAFCLHTTGKKQVAVNNVAISKMGELMGYLNCIYFSPDEIKIISKSPSERRRFLDIDLCQTDKNYYYSLSRFNKALAQRNNLLKQAKSLDEFEQMSFVWDNQIAQEGARVVAKRLAFCQKLKNYATRCHGKLTQNKEQLQLQYVTQIEGQTIAEMTQNYLCLLQKNTQKDFSLRYTSVGCQRDDIALKIDGVDVRSFGSQGQQRTTALSLKLAELTIFKDLIGEYPVLLLDDVLSELDEQRQQSLLNFDQDLQILLTTATPISDKIAPKATRFALSNGVCAKR